ncbi:hypothetical protein HY497_01735 [Candidatus Woesearchaeota archaeon]|nr:hypothetical protein [Candidatus Woesearchaeota archaeon]
MAKPVVKMNESEDISQKINTLRENRRTGNDDNVLDTKISLSVKSIASVVLVIAFMAGAFLVGRYVFPSGAPLTDRVSAAATVESDVTEGAADSAESAAVSGDAIPEPDEETAESAAAEVADAAEEPGSTEEVAEPAVDPVANDVVVTEGYESVVLEFTRTPAFEWKGTWGKITTIYYSIANGEAGTIKPDKFRLIAEGYETAEFIKTADVPTLDRTIAPGETVKHGVDLKIQYSESVTDPANLRLTLQLLDADGNVIDAVNQEFNLKE